MQCRNFQSMLTLKNCYINLHNVKKIVALFYCLFKNVFKSCRSKTDFHLLFLSINLIKKWRTQKYMLDFVI